jgi:hypothetical protein
MVVIGLILLNLKRVYDNIFVITHNPLVNNWSNNVVKITKIENISKVSQ